MKSVRYIPLAFIAGVHGFAMLAPYVLVIIAVDHVLRRRREGRLVPQQ